MEIDQVSKFLRKKKVNGPPPGLYKPIDKQKVTFELQKIKKMLKEPKKQKDMTFEEIEAQISM